MRPPNVSNRGAQGETDNVRPHRCFAEDKDESRGCKLRHMLKNESSAEGFGQSPHFTKAPGS